MIQRTGAWMFALAAGIGVAAAIASYLIVGVETSGVAARDTAFVAGLAAFGISLVSSQLAQSIVRRRVHELAVATRDVVRDTNRRVPPIHADPDDEIRQLAEWVNFLADDAERSHRGLARERELLSTVADGLTQGVIAVDGDHKIELLNDAARRMLGVASSPVGEPLIEFVRVPEVFALIDSDEAASAEVELHGGDRKSVV